MASEVVYNDIISKNKLFGNLTDELLNTFKGKISLDLNEGVDLRFELNTGSRAHKISPILRYARPEDASEIVKIYKDVYNGTYPYKEMEDENEVQKMILSPNFHWIMFLDKDGNNVGCFTFILDFKKKRGYIRGLMFKKKYQGRFDAVKATIGSIFLMYYMYKDRIFVWYCENRTAHAKSQYVGVVCSLKEIAFFPNKDLFLDKIESVIMQVAYDRRALTTLRCKDIPKVIPVAKACLDYSNNRYHLGSSMIIEPKFTLDMKLLENIQKRIKKKIERDKFGYVDISFNIEGSESYFKFLYTPTVNNFEKTRYKVENLEELFVFVSEFQKCMKELNVRYCEVYVSAYEPEHQKIFFNSGLIPRGYIPSWKYSLIKDKFEDSIIFNFYKGKIDKNLFLLEEGEELLKTLNL